MSAFPALNNAELESISNILGDTSTGFTGNEIGRLLLLCHIPDAWPNGTKRKRIFNSLAEECNRAKSSNCVYAFISEALEPSRWLDAPEAHSAMRTKINEVLALKGIQLNDENRYVQVTIDHALPVCSWSSKVIRAVLGHFHAFCLPLPCGRGYGVGPKLMLVNSKKKSC